MLSLIATVVNANSFLPDTVEIGILFSAIILEKQNYSTILLDAELGVRAGYHQILEDKI